MAFCSSKEDGTMEMTTTQRPTRTDETRDRIIEAFARLQANRWNLANTTAEERIARLKHLKRAILQRQDALKAAIHADFRKPAAETELTELQPVLGELN